MTAAVAVMSVSSTTPVMPKRHGFSIESLIGKADSPPSSPRSSPPAPPQLSQQPSLVSPPPMLGLRGVVHSAALSPSSGSITSSSRSTPSLTPSKQSSHVTTPRPLPVRPFSKESSRDEKTSREREMIREREILREREIRDYRESESRAREREIELIREREAREREMVIESMRGRERELREVRELRDRAEMARERELRDQRESLDGRAGSNHFHSSPRSNSPPSPRMEKSVSPESENRLSAWGGEEFKHLLGGFPAGHIDSNGMYQPLRVCNRALASMNGLAGPPPGPLGVSMPPQFAHLPMNPFFTRDLPPQAHPLLAARYPGFMHHRYPMGPPPGLLFHPYRKPKRNRTAFSPSQLLQLEQAFEKNHYVVGQERKTLAAKLQLSETQVKVWFQNRRTKHKRMKAEEDGGSSGTHSEGQSGMSGKDEDGSDLTTYVEHDDDVCTSEDEEELSVTEDI